MANSKATATLIAELASDPNAVCPGCEQPLADHNLGCRMSRKGEKRDGSKGECEYCGGPAHNSREKKTYQSQACAARIVLGDDAEKAPYMRQVIAIAASYAEKPFRFIFDGSDGSTVRMVSHPATVARTVRTAAPAATPAPTPTVVAPAPAPAAAPVAATNGSEPVQPRKGKAKAKAALANLAS